MLISTNAPNHSDAELRQMIFHPAEGVKRRVINLKCKILNRNTGEITIYRMDTDVPDISGLSVDDYSNALDMIVDRTIRDLHPGCTRVSETRTF